MLHVSCTVYIVMFLRIPCGYLCTPSSCLTTLYMCLFAHASKDEKVNQSDHEPCLQQAHEGTTGDFSAYQVLSLFYFDCEMKKGH